MALSDGDDVGRWWAGQVLAYMGALVEADHERLWKRNEAYGWQRKELGRMLRLMCGFLGIRCIRRCTGSYGCVSFTGGRWHYLLGSGIRRRSGGRMPGEYESVLELAPLSAKSWKDWEKILWRLVELHNPDLPGILEERYKRAEGRRSQYRTEFRRHLRKIALAM